MSIFAPDSKLSTVLNTIGSLIILNLLTLLCSLPVVTAGAAYSAMYRILIQIVRKEDGHICSSFFHAFRENLGRSTLIWLLGGGLCFVMIFDIWLLKQTVIPMGSLYRAVLFVLALAVLLFTCFALVTSSYFENTVKNNIINGLKFSLVHPLMSLLVLGLTVSPFLVLYLTMRLLPLVFLLGLSGPGYFAALYFADLFDEYAAGKRKKTDDPEMENGSEDGSEDRS